MEDVHVTVVYGFRNGTIYVSARARGVDLDLGEALREAFGDLGSAGGHNNMAGAQISMGLFEAVDDASEAEMTEMVEDVIEKRLYQVIDPPTIEE
jgi:nanoRNase/pAp phosphatase (c-di-AMP/oligoRNAs hydrolase)